MAVHVFGIRHHGPGSARSLLQSLRQLGPDLVLVEGPVEGDDQIHWVANEGVQPPVALLVYRPDEPLSSVFYPFARFSPEWNALKFALEHHIPVQFMDLPKSNWMALEEDPKSVDGDQDPIQTIARLAGDEDFERWWDRLVESRGDSDIFSAVYEAMAALRADGSKPARPIDNLREAAMRQQIRQAQKQGFQRIAVVCGAWHGPALTNMPAAKEDATLLKGLPKVKVQVTWVPWTHSRLMRASGYGAGIESPGWYEHLWTNTFQPIEHWLSKVAHLLRAEDLDASPAQVVDAVRLAETLASFRGRRHPGLPELNDATQAALLFGNAVPLRLISEQLIVGQAMGEVPPEATAVPIQKDLEALQKRLRLKAEPVPRQIDLDLRKEGDRERSQLLHRLNILNIAWGRMAQVHGKLGTFHEVWQTRWEPEFAVDLIAAARWGNTVEAASSNHVRHLAQTAEALPALTALLEPVLKANLPDAAPALLNRLREIAAVAPDVADLMDTIPPLARVARYGDVRQTDRTMVQQAIQELSARVCVGLPVACGSLNDDAARTMVDRMGAFNQAITLLEDAELKFPWREALRKVADLPHGHALVAGRCCRLLHDAAEMTGEDISARASQSLSPGTESSAGAAWIEGFLEKSGSVLLLDHQLWNLIDTWVQSLTADTFNTTLPLLRRTFSSFPAAERRQIGERVREGAMGSAPAANQIDQQRASLALPLLTKLLGLNHNDN
jgi:hypothetical protein